MIFWVENCRLTWGWTLKADKIHTFLFAPNHLTQCEMNQCKHCVNRIKHNLKLALSVNEHGVSLFLSLCTVSSMLEGR